MIISSAPYRISLFGGGTDYRDFYNSYGGFVIGFGINKRSYICARYTPNILNYYTKLSYSQLEFLNPQELPRNNAIRGCFQLLNWDSGVEIICLADIPSASGLSTSSSFIVSLIQALRKLKNERFDKRSLALDAINVERNILGEPGGEQDQIFAAYSGFISIKFDHSGFVVSEMPITYSFIEYFLSRSFLYYVGSGRNSFDIANHSNSSFPIKRKILDISLSVYDDFVNGNLDSIAQKLRQSWELKRNIKNGISNDNIESLLHNFYEDGVIGAKLLGAGSSGFIFGILKDTHVNIFRSKYKNRLVDFSIDYDGATIQQV